MVMIDVFVRMAATPAVPGVVAESIRWAAGADPAARRHQVVTLFGDPSITHLAWAVAAANRGAPDDLVWRIASDGSATTADLSLATAVLRDDAAMLLLHNGPQLRTAIAHLASVNGHDEHRAAIRVPLNLAAAIDVDEAAMLASLREAEGDVDIEQVEDDIAA
jgi:hypothetical protein